MKTNFLILMAFVFFTFYSFAQTNTWTKDDRTNIYNDCMGFIGKYPNLTIEQKKSISMCYLNEIEKQYSKQEYQNKIDVEIEMIRETTLILCSKNLGIELLEQKKEEPRVELTKEEGNIELAATKENITGHWKDENSEFWLFETGDYKMQYYDGKRARGTWKIYNNQLSLSKQKFLSKSEKSFKILLFTKDKFVYQSIKRKEDTYTATKVK
ncbi:MAG: hypothetical protein ABIJ97_16585 [Bacteroidota bacterium]